MTLVIGTRQDMGPVTRQLAAHPEWHYHAVAGDGGSIVIIIDELPGRGALTANEHDGQNVGGSGPPG
jgi:hypothetical protein